MIRLLGRKNKWYTAFRKICWVILTIVYVVMALQSKKKVEITLSAMVEMNVKSGSYFDQTLTVLLTMKIHSYF